VQKLSDKKITIIDRSGQTVSAPVKKGSFFGLFASRRDEAPRENTATLLKEPSLKSSSLNVPHANLSAVKNWIALEEKIVHDYKEQGTAPLKNAASLPEISTKQARPAFQTFSVQTGVSLSSSVPKLKASLRASERKSSKLGKFLMITGGLAAGALVFLYFQATFSNRETSQELAQLQSAKDKLSWSYAVLKNASENQSAEMKWMQGQYRDMASELRAAQAGKVSTEQSLEKKYREELMRITVRYESELAALRNTVETQQAIVNALKAQGRAFDKIIDQAGMSALSGAAAGLSRDTF